MTSERTTCSNRPATATPRLEAKLQQGLRQLPQRKSNRLLQLAHRPAKQTAAVHMVTKLGTVCVMFAAVDR